MSKEDLEKRQAEANRRRRAQRSISDEMDADAEFDRLYPPSGYGDAGARRFGSPIRATPVVKKDGAS